MRARDNAWLIAASCFFAIGLEAGVASAETARCGACRAVALRQALRLHRASVCRHDISARLQATLERCRRRRACADSDAEVRRALDDVARVVETRCLRSLPEVDDVLLPRAVRGPVGATLPSAEAEAAASFEEVAAYCEHPDFAGPPLLELPGTAGLPSWCSEQDAYADMVARCGTPRVVVVSEGADLAAATGSAVAPYPSVPDALESCGHDGCHVLLGPGTYPDPIYVYGCVFLEGGVTVADGVVKRGGVRPRIRGLVQRIRPKPIILARVEVGSLILDTEAESLVSDAVVRGGGVSAGWNALGPRICRTQIGATSEGASVGWHSGRLWIAGSAIASCRSAADASWGSHDLQVLDSVLYGHMAAVGTSWGSTGVLVQGSILASPREAVSIDLTPDVSQENPVPPATFDVTVTGNRIRAGSLPESDPALNIVIEDNVVE